MADRSLFGTDGVRGHANSYPMTIEMAMQLGRAAGYVLRNGKRRHRLVIGKDTRLSGYMIESALVAGICAMGVDVQLVGPLPTPGIAFITNSMRADAGVVISASHNPYIDNGIKFFANDGFKLADQLEQRIEALVRDNKLEQFSAAAQDVGKAYRIDDAVGRYVVFLKHSFPPKLDLTGMRIVIDCAHGAAYRVGPAVLEELGADVIALNVSPDGTNINESCGSLHPKAVAEAVKAYRADVGFALDGDADRVVFVDEQGKVVDGDYVLAVCATDLLQRQALAQNTLVATVMSNLGLDQALASAGGRVIKTPVGDRHVVEEMRRGGYNLGGEQSGHMIFLDHNTTGDGMVSALQLLAIMQRQQRPLSELTAIMTPLPQVLVNVRIPQREPIEQVASVQEAVTAAETELGDKGRVLLRYSGTEPLLRIMLEGEDAEQIQKLADHIADAVVASLQGERVEN